MTLGWGEESGHWHKPCPTVHKNIIARLVYYNTAIRCESHLLALLKPSRCGPGVSNRSVALFLCFCFSAVSLLFPFNRTEEKIFQFQFHHAGDVAVSCGGKKKKKKCFCLTPYFVHAIAQLLFLYVVLLYFCDLYLMKSIRPS